jgi:hypothetical protein
MPDLNGVDLEIIGRQMKIGDNGAVFRPKSLRINGVETVCPDGAELLIATRFGKGVLNVTLTMMARSVSIRDEADA